MKVGNYELFPIETGRFALDGGAMFGVVPKTLWGKSNPPDEKNRIPMAARALLLIGNGRKILVDVGNGSKFSEKFISIYKIDSSEFSLLKSLKDRGITPDQITDVLLTHLHFDHAGGSTTMVNGVLHPTFPNARYYVQRAHWEAALNPTERDRASFFRDDFIPLQEHGVLQFTEGESEVFPGVSVRLVHGHTAFLQCPIISDGTTTVFYCADLMPTVSHVQLPWIMAYDLRPLVTMEEKRSVLADAVEKNWVLFFEHDAATAAIRLMRGEKGIVAGETVRL
jgi:glyoxylase-like metal-dependent hydrolase (beta-lactamase superfamily II)